MSGGIDPIFAREFDELRGHDGLTSEERFAKFRVELTELDPREAEIARLRAALAAAEATIARQREALEPQ
jgi:hypothetical protein